MVGHLFALPYEKKMLIAMPLYCGSLLVVFPMSDITVIEQAMTQIITGLIFMHGKRILHRDLKPENILVARKSPIHIVLADLGWATSFDDELALKKTCGTVRFNAPEIPEYESSVIQTPAIDVYALGATFYFMLRPEQYRLARYKTAQRNATNHPPKNYAGLVFNMMAQDPKERPSLRQCLDVVNKRLYTWPKEGLQVTLRPEAEDQSSTKDIPNTLKQTLQTLVTNDVSHARALKLPPRAPVAKNAGIRRLPPGVELVKPKPSKPSHTCGVDFNTPPPPYEMATNIFADVARRQQKDNRFAKPTGQQPGVTLKIDKYRQRERLGVDMNLKNKAPKRDLFEPRGTRAAQNATSNKLVSTLFLVIPSQTLPFTTSGVNAWSENLLPDTIILSGSASTIRLLVINLLYALLALQRNCCATRHSAIHFPLKAFQTLIHTLNRQR